MTAPEPETRDGQPKYGTTHRIVAGSIIIVVVVSALSLSAGYALKSCASVSPRRTVQYLCYTDIEFLYKNRGIKAHVFPYVHDPAHFPEPGRGAIEYPVLTGLFMWASGLPVSTPGGYLLVSAALLAPFGLAIGYLLGRMAGRRALLWAAAPPLILFAFHNWDLLAVFCTVLGLWFQQRDRRVAAGLWFGIGAAFKLYPALFLAPLFLSKWHEGDRRTALRALGAGLGVIAIVNIPFAAINFRGWRLTYAFHASRIPNFDSVWFLPFRRVGSGVINAIIGLLFLASVAAILVSAYRSFIERRSYPLLATSGALVAAFIAFNKIQSPQYTLWLLPFFVLLDIRVWWWIAYVVNDVVLYISVFYLERVDHDVFKYLTQAGAVVRAAILLALVVAFCVPSSPFAHVITPVPSRTGRGSEVAPSSEPT